MKLSALFAVSVISITAAAARETIPIPEECGMMLFKFCDANHYCERGVR
jgi:hypothetical protein